MVVERKGGGGTTVTQRVLKGGGGAAVGEVEGRCPAWHAKWRRRRGGLVGQTWPRATWCGRGFPAVDRNVEVAGAYGGLRPVEQGRWATMGHCSRPAQKE
jgi:hypothetical protein